MARRQTETVSRRAVLIFGAATALGPSEWSASSSVPNRNRVVFVLVHPAWLGGWCWNKVAPLLRSRGHAVYTPTLTGLGERAHLADPKIGLAMHVEDVVNVIEFEGLHRVILVGNSSGGMVITGVAERVPDRVAHVVYLDAFVPNDGQNLVDLLPSERRQAMEELVKAEGDGWQLPRFAALSWERIVDELWDVTSRDDASWMLARLKPTPFRHFTDRVAVKRRDTANFERTYVRCLQFRQAAFDRHAALARQSSSWRYRELATSHLPYITHPTEVAVLLADLSR